MHAESWVANRAFVRCTYLCVTQGELTLTVLQHVVRSEQSLGWGALSSQQKPNPIINNDNDGVPNPSHPSGAAYIIDATMDASKKQILLTLHETSHVHCCMAHVPRLSPTEISAYNMWALMR